MPEHSTCTHRTYLLDCHGFDGLRARSAGRCEVCGIPESETPRGVLLIDHDHALGFSAVRGLVCPGCNHLLGRVDAGQSAPDHLADAVARYLSDPWVTTVDRAIRPTIRNEIGERVLPVEMSVRSVRDGLADVVHQAAVRDRITYVTSNGRRIAAFVPVSLAEAADESDAPPS